MRLLKFTRDVEVTLLGTIEGKFLLFKNVGPMVESNGEIKDNTVYTICCFNRNLENIISTEYIDLATRLFKQYIAQSTAPRYFIGISEIFGDSPSEIFTLSYSYNWDRALKIREKLFNEIIYGVYDLLFDSKDDEYLRSYNAERIRIWKLMDDNTLKIVK